MRRLLIGQISRGIRAFAEDVGERRIARGGDAVADAFGAEMGERVADGVGAADFAGVGDAVQAAGRGVVEGRAEIGGGQGEFVAADAEGDDAFTAQFDGDAGDFHRGLRAELAHAVENPLQAQAQRFVEADGFANGAEIGGRVLLAQEHHAGRERDFGVDDVLGQQAFGSFAGDKGVIFGGAQVRGDPFVGLDEGDEIVRRVARGDLAWFDRIAVAGCQFDDRGRLDGAFEM